MTLDAIDLAPIGPDWMQELAERERGIPAKGTRVLRVASQGHLRCPDARRYRRRKRETQP